MPILGGGAFESIDYLISIIRMDEHFVELYERMGREGAADKVVIDELCKPHLDRLSRYKGVSGDG